MFAAAQSDRVWASEQQPVIAHRPSRGSVASQADLHGAWLGAGSGQHDTPPEAKRPAARQFDLPEGQTMSPAQRADVLQQLRSFNKVRQLGGVATPQGDGHHLGASGTQRSEQQPDSTKAPTVEFLPRVVSSVKQYQPRSLGEVTLARNSNSFFWWDDPAQSFTQGTALCASYGGSLAVLASVPSSLPSGLVPGVEYWIGLFNSAQLAGRNGSWAWADLALYQPSTARWAVGQPSARRWCAYLAWDHALEQWQWYAGDCSAKRAALCSLPSLSTADGLVSKSAGQPFSCVRGMQLSAGPVLVVSALQDSGNATVSVAAASQHPQLCAAHCRANARCDAFFVAGAQCMLQARPSTQLVQVAANASISVSCLRYGLDLISAGRALALHMLSPGPSASAFKCMANYRVNFDLVSTLSGVCSAAECASFCANSSSSHAAPTVPAGMTGCTIMQHDANSCQCQLGRKPLYGLDEQVVVVAPPNSDSGVRAVVCMRHDGDFLRFGVLQDPSVVQLQLGQRLLTFHPEPLSYDAAFQVCSRPQQWAGSRRGAVMGGALASVDTLHSALVLASKLLLRVPPRLWAPAQGVAPGMYGMWVGLAGTGAALQATMQADDGEAMLDWAGGEPVNGTLMQMVWAVLPTGIKVHLPSATAQRQCVHFSNASVLLRPGLAVADSCNWELPFVCEAELPMPLSVVTTSHTLAAANTAAGTSTFSSLASDTSTSSSAAIATAEAVDDVPGSTTASSSSAVSTTGGTAPPDMAVTYQPALPRLVTVHDTGVLMWAQPEADTAVPQALAKQWCGMWNASLATVYNATAQEALETVALVSQAPYWLNLAVNHTTHAWQWGPPNTLVNSSDYLDGFQGWCSTQVPNASAGNPECSQLAFYPDGCSAYDPSGLGWGWFARNCSASSSYMCMASPRGSPGHFFCADGYDLGGTVVGATNFISANAQEAATYCSDLCTSQAACHTFTVMGSLCVRKSRNATSLALDLVRPNVTIGCFKYGLLWDMLGTNLAVQARVAADASTRWRCVRFQDVARTNLLEVPLSVDTCQVSNCTALCFTTTSCSVAVFEHTSCTCTLARNPLSGEDGTNDRKDGITTCFYDSNDAFLGLGQVRSGAYIKPPAPGTPPAGASGDWLGGSPDSDGSSSSGSVDDINFVPIGSNGTNSTLPPSPGLNPSDPSAPKQPLLPLTGAPYPPPPDPPKDTGNSTAAPPTSYLPSLPPLVPADQGFWPAPVPHWPAPLTAPPTLPPPPHPSPPVQPLPAVDGRPSTPFGLSAMIGITAGFCGGAALLLSLAVVMLRRRHLAVQRALLQGKGGGDAAATVGEDEDDEESEDVAAGLQGPAAHVPGGASKRHTVRAGGPFAVASSGSWGGQLGDLWFGNPQHSDVSTTSEQALSALRSCGLSADLERTLTLYVEAWAGASHSSASASTAVWLAAAATGRASSTNLAGLAAGVPATHPGATALPLATPFAAGRAVGYEVAPTTAAEPTAALPPPLTRAQAEELQAAILRGQQRRALSLGDPTRMLAHATAAARGPSSAAAAVAGVAAGETETGVNPSGTLSAEVVQALEQLLHHLQAAGRAAKLRDAVGLARVPSAAARGSVSSSGGAARGAGGCPVLSSMSSLGRLAPSAVGGDVALHGLGACPGPTFGSRARGAEEGEKLGESKEEGEDALALASHSGVSSSYITLSRLLGAGSFGTVYEGRWRRQTVAVKIIPHSPAAAQRVKNEVELSMKFDHPNVVRSYFYETFDARPSALGHAGTQLDAHAAAVAAHRESQETWIVLEFCSGGSLASRLYGHATDCHTGITPGAGALATGTQQAAAAAGGASHVEDGVMPRPLHERDPCIASLEGVLDIALGVAQGMAYMHSLSICHGDLKCENVLLGSLAGASAPPDPGQVVAKVGDFGLSRAMGDGPVGSHLSTATVGTVTHMPPELLLSGRLRPSCDVYSFGVMLWQLYTGAVPYQGMRYAEIVYKVAVCNLRPSFAPDTPCAYRELAEDCWQSDATLRPSFEQVILRLRSMRQRAPQLDGGSCQTSISSAHTAAPRACSGSAQPTSFSCGSGPGAGPQPPAQLSLAVCADWQASDDITLLSPWIAACPEPGSGLAGSQGSLLGTTAALGSLVQLAAAAAPLSASPSLESVLGALAPGATAAAARGQRGMLEPAAGHVAPTNSQATSCSGGLGDAAAGGGGAAEGAFGEVKGEGAGSKAWLLPLMGGGAGEGSSGLRSHSGSSAAAGKPAAPAAWAAPAGATRHLLAHRSGNTHQEEACVVAGPGGLQAPTRDPLLLLSSLPSSPPLSPFTTATPVCCSVSGQPESHSSALTAGTGAAHSLSHVSVSSAGAGGAPESLSSGAALHSPAACLLGAAAPWTLLGGVGRASLPGTTASAPLDLALPLAPLSTSGVPYGSVGADGDGDGGAPRGMAAAAAPRPWLACTSCPQWEGWRGSQQPGAAALAGTPSLRLVANAHTLPLLAVPCGWGLGPGGGEQARLGGGSSSSSAGALQPSPFAQPPLQLPAPWAAKAPHSPSARRPPSPANLMPCGASPEASVASPALSSSGGGATLAQVAVALQPQPSMLTLAVQSSTHELPGSGLSTPTPTTAGTADGLSTPAVAPTLPTSAGATESPSLAVLVQQPRLRPQALIMTSPWATQTCQQQQPSQAGAPWLVAAQGEVGRAPCEPGASLQPHNKEQEQRPGSSLPAQQLTGSTETHVTLRALCPSHVVMGLHGLSLGGLEDGGQSSEAAVRTKRWGMGGSDGWPAPGTTAATDELKARGRL